MLYLQNEEILVEEVHNYPYGKMKNHTEIFVRNAWEKVAEDWTFLENGKHHFF